MYLGSLYIITEDGRSEKEIKKRILIALTTFTNMRTLLSCRGINLKITSNKMLYPADTYGAETWTITKSVLSRLDAFELWVYRRVLTTSNFVSCAFVDNSAPYISASLICPCPVHIPLDIHVHFPVAQHSRHLLSLPPALHYVGDFRIEFSIFRQR